MPSETTIITLDDLRVGMLVQDAGKDYGVLKLSLISSEAICATIVPMEFWALDPIDQEKSKVYVIGSKEMPITVYQ